MSNDFSTLDRGFSIVRESDVTIEATANSKNHPIAQATFGDRFVHRFDTKSRVSRALETMSPGDLAERLSSSVRTVSSSTFVIAIITGSSTPMSRSIDFWLLSGMRPMLMVHTRRSRRYGAKTVSRYLSTTLVVISTHA